MNEWMDSNMDPDIVGAFQYSSSSGLRLAVGSFVEDYDNKVQVKQIAWGETLDLILKWNVRNRYIEISFKKII